MNEVNERKLSKYNINTDEFLETIFDILDNDGRVGIRKIKSKDGSERIEVIEEKIKIRDKIPV